MTSPVFFGNNKYFELFFNDLGLSDSAIKGILTAITVYTFSFLSICLVLYILRAIGIYTMAKNNDISKPWIAFVPVINSFNLGKIAEKYKKNYGSKSASFSLLLLIFNLFKLVLVFLIFVLGFNAVSTILGFAQTAIENNTEMTLDMFVSVVPVIICYVALFGFSLAFAITKFIALWRIYSLYDNKNAVLYTVLSILFNFLDPIFIFILRNKNINRENVFFTENSESGL